MTAPFVTKRSKLRSYFIGKNFLTPTIEGYIGNTKYAIELSRGTGLNQSKIYGVTVVDRKDKSRDKSRLCHSIGEAENFIISLLKEE
jgi:hypothetical protein